MSAKVKPSKVRPHHRALAILKQDGLRTLWFKLLGETIYRRMWLFERDLTIPIGSEPSSGIVEFGELEEADFEEMKTLRSYSGDEALLERQRRGDLCFVARQDGKLVAFAWAQMQRAWIEYLQMTMELEADEAYIYEVTVAPAQRNRGIARALYRHAYSELKQDGVRRVVFAVNFENQAGLRALTRNGEQRVAICGRWRVPGPKRHFIKPFEPARDEPHGASYWDGVTTELGTRGEFYLGNVLAEIKQRAYGRLFEAWAQDLPAGQILKTDVFEESNAVDALLPKLETLARPLIGMDISPHTAHRAMKNDLCPPATFVAGDVRRLPFETDSVALVVSPSTLDHFRDRHELGHSLREIRRVLHPQGTLLLTLDNRENIGDPALRLAGWMGLVPYYLGRSYSMAEMNKELINAGFQLHATRTIIQHPRLLGVASTWLTGKLGWRWPQWVLRQSLLWLEGFEESKWARFLGCFVAAKATPQAEPALAAEVANQQPGGLGG